MEIKPDDVKSAFREIDNWNKNITCGTSLTVLRSLEKQMPKKVAREPAVWPDGRDRVKLFCPTCHDGYELSPDEKYCSECGQKLDWSENDG